MAVITGGTYQGAEPSKGHVCWLVSEHFGTVREAVVRDDGELFLCSASTVLEASGYRAGRWEAPAWQAAARLAMLREDYREEVE